MEENNELKLVMWPDERLSTPCYQDKICVNPVSDEDKKFIRQMYAWLKEHAKEAVGIAAPQFGVSKPMFCVRLSDPKTSKVVLNLQMINPMVYRIGKENFVVNGGEGCLSEPKIKSKGVTRAKVVLLRGYDLISKKHIAIKLSDYPAAIVQHEMDHLKGICLSTKNANRI